MSYNKETGLYEGYIYCITNNVNGKQYIGQTIRTVEDRYKAHLNTFKRNPCNLYLYTAMTKYGDDNFSVKEMEKVESNTKRNLTLLLNEKEIFYIKQYNTLKPNGYNMTKGGVLLPNTYEMKPVCNYDLERNFVKEFESVTDAARYYGISQADISHCCKREKVKIVKGFIWRFKGDDYDVKTIELNTRIICQYDLYGNFINKYNGEYEAIKATGFSNIGNCCKGKCLSSGSYVWRYDNEPFDKYELPQFKKVYVYDSNYNYIRYYISITDAAQIYNVKPEKIRQYCRNKKQYFEYFWSFTYSENPEDIKKEKMRERCA